VISLHGKASFDDNMQIQMTSEQKL